MQPTQLAMTEAEALQILHLADYFENVARSEWADDRQKIALDYCQAKGLLDNQDKLTDAGRLAMAR